MASAGIFWKSWKLDSSEVSDKDICEEDISELIIDDDDEDDELIQKTDNILLDSDSLYSLFVLPVFFYQGVKSIEWKCFVDRFETSPRLKRH